MDKKKRRKELKPIELEWMIMYYAALAVLAVLFVAAVCFLFFGDGIISSAKACQFHELTGFYCPGCGGTRAFYYLSHFQIGKSIYYHFVVFYAIASMIFYSVNCFLYRRIPKLKFLMNPFILLCSGAILLLIRMAIINIIPFITGVPYM